MEQLSQAFARLRESQFAVPALLIAGSLGLAFWAQSLDTTLIEDGRTFLIPSEIAATRTLLATVAGAIITVAGLVFSMTALTVQLASSQYSPRVIKTFMRDRFQQVVLGVVMGTFTFALTGLAIIGSDESNTSRADWTATGAVILGIASALLIVAFIDHVTRRIRIDDTIERLAELTVEAIHNLSSRGDAHPGDTNWSFSDRTDPHTVRATRTGWIEEINIERLMRQVDENSIVRVEAAPGSHLTKGNRLLTIWSDEPPSPELSKRLVACVEMGSRTIQNAPSFGIRQLVDIALRALSPGINDPATASDVVKLLMEPVRAIHLSGSLDRVHRDSERSVLVVEPQAYDLSSYVHMAFSDIRRAGADQPIVLAALAESLGSLLEELESRGVPRSGLEAEVAALSKQVSVSPLDQRDLLAVQSALDKHISSSQDRS